jgi:hypothetical protein
MYGKVVGITIWTNWCKLTSCNSACQHNVWSREDTTSCYALVLTKCAKSPPKYIYRTCTPISDCGRFFPLTVEHPESRSGDWTVLTIKECWYKSRNYQLTNCKLTPVGIRLYVSIMFDPREGHITSRLLACLAIVPNRYVQVAWTCVHLLALRLFSRRCRTSGVPKVGIRT